jgi:diadenylate cyclase
LLIEGTRAFNLLKGLGILLLVWVATKYLNSFTANWILENTLPAGFLALVIIFQPELRRALEDIGRGSFLVDQMVPGENLSEIVREISKAVTNCARKRVGVLIVIEQDIGLKDFIDKGVRLGSQINAEILNTIFMPFTPLHDGAVIIKGGHIEAAACFLPISQDADLAREFGTRHRAAVGITEITDAIAIIVSEETGQVSVAKMGRLQRDLNEERIKEVLTNAFRKINRPRKLLPLK